MLKNSRGSVLATTALGLALALGGCGGSNSNNGTGSNDPAEPAFSAARFSAASATVTNQYLPLVPLTTLTYQAETEDGVETTVVEVLDKTVDIEGVECRAVRDRVFLDDVLIEDTEDWFAQDDEGNVWYLGEDVVNYEFDDNGDPRLDDQTGEHLTNDDGAWEAGVDGAEPGIVMKAAPAAGDSYRQEYYAGVAEDMGRITVLNVTVTLDDGTTYTNCLQTEDWSALEPDVRERKSYAPGVGVVREEHLDEPGAGPVEMRGLFDTGPGSLPDFSAAVFSAPTAISNNYLPLTPGTTRTFVADTDDGVETVVVEILNETRVVSGVECRVVRDRVFLDGVLVEDTHDWFAQDDDGNVWYLGEDVVNYEFDDNGDPLLDDQTGEQLTNDDGAWETGIDGAEAGIVMWAAPQVDQSYRQEFYQGNAEDLAAVVALGVAVELGDGTTYDDCLQTLEWSPLAPFALEHKYYAPGVGLVLEQALDGSNPVELEPAE